MSYLGSFNIGDYVTFSCTTHNSTGVQVADASPVYRVYEDNTSTALLTGSMSQLDSTNVPNLYYGRIQATGAAGFEESKCYTVSMSGVVGGISGVTTRQFQISAHVNANIVSTGAGVITSDSFLDPIPADVTTWNASPVSTNYIFSDFTTSVASGVNALGYTSTRAAKLDNLDTTISSRLSSASYTTPPTSGQNATAVWANGTRSLTSNVTAILPANAISSTTFASSSITLRSISPDVVFYSVMDTDAITASSVSTGAVDKISDYIWNDTPRTLTTSVTAVVPDKTGYTLTAAEHTAIQTDVASGLNNMGYTSTRSGYLDATISSRLASASYTTPPTTGQIASAVWSNPTRTLDSSERTAIAQAILGSNVDGTFTLEQIMDIVGSVLGSKCTVAGSTITFRDLSDTKNIVTMDTDSAGTRTAITYNV